MSNFIPQFTGHVITYPCWDLSETLLVKGAQLITTYSRTNILWQPCQKMKCKVYHWEKGKQPSTMGLFLPFFYFSNCLLTAFALAETLWTNSQRKSTWCTNPNGPAAGQQGRSRVRILPYKQGKSEGFDICDRPSYLTQIGFNLSIFQPVWPWNLMDGIEKQ